MTNNKNNPPLYAEELTLNQEQTNIQQILNQFKQIGPVNFIELTNAKKNNWGSTEDLDKPLCERYLFSWENKRIWLDIPHNLMEKLELPVGENCPRPFYLDPKVLEREEVEGAITIKNESEIFLDKPLTINSLASALQRWLTEIKTLKEKVQTLEQEKIINQQTITNLTTERDDYQTKWDISLEELEQKEEIINGYSQKTEELESEREKLSSDFQTANILIINLRTLLRTDDLNNLPQIPEGETLTSLLARPTLIQLQGKQDKINDLEEERTNIQGQINNKDRRINELTAEQDNRPNITHTRWNDYKNRPTQQQLNNLQQEKSDLQTQLNNVRTELNTTKSERDDHLNMWNSHTCPSTYCSREHHTGERCTGQYGCNCTCNRTGGRTSHDRGCRE